jgi:threonine dehydrogenase-like Zn-dependent dehydrogenase
MPNPWLEIPLADYEAHMAAVRQLELLSDLFAEALAVRRPGSVAVLGVAGGNGLERIDSRLTRRVVGIDIHPEYLEAVGSRYADLAGLELHCIDLSQQAVQIPPVDLVHAALVFEHAGTDRALENAVSLVAADGALSVVLQLPSPSEQEIGPSGVASILLLKDHFSPIAPLRLHEKLHQRGLQPVWETQRTLPAGKSFWMGVFLRA